MTAQKSEDHEVASPGPDRIYSNHGNGPLIDLLIPCGEIKRVLDIGCGAGDNAILVKSKFPGCEIFGITRSAAEARRAERHMTRCWVFDIERELPGELVRETFDILIFSHVLEHLRDPDIVLNRFSRLLRKGGHVLIAVPNVLSWRMRIQFLLGRFEYESAGTLDDTHLRFFTYFTAAEYLLSKSQDLRVTYIGASGSVPLWWLRRHILPAKLARSIDSWGCRHWPNLFGGQVLIRAVK